MTDRITAAPQEGETVDLTDLTFEEVRVANVTRCARWHHQDTKPWTLADWSNAMCGEAGEAANVVKKLRRIELGTRGLTDPSEDDLRKALADEIADVFLYLQLLADAAGIEMAAAIRSKFNEVSERQDFPDRIRADPDRTEVLDVTADRITAAIAQGGTMQLAHSVDEALSRFQLVNGAGDGDKTACAMSLLNWIWRNGDEWSDSPACAHPLIRSVVINANDDAKTTPEDRAELVRLGLDGVLDTWWVPTEVVVFHLSRPRDTEPPSRLETAKKLLGGIISWKDDRQRVDLVRANLARAYLASAYLADANLARADLAGANLRDANLARARYSSLTTWPAEFDPSIRGAVKL